MTLASVLHRPGFRFPFLCATCTVALSACSEVTAPPNPPDTLVATLAAPITVSLSWSPRPKRERVTSYIVFRNGSPVAEVADSSFTDANLVESMTFTYSVIAKSGTGQESPQSNPVSISTRDATPPRIVQSFPANGAGPLPIATIVVELVFSEAMDSATMTPSNITLTLSPTGAVIPATANYFKRQQYAEVRALSALPAPATITVTAGTGLKDLAGNALTAPFSFSFKTHETVRPRVIATTPVNGATNLPLNQVMTITFSEQMKPSFFDIGIFESVEGYIGMRVISYDTVSNVLTFTSPGGLRSNRRYSIASGWNFPATDLAGNALEPFSVSFTTVDLGIPYIIEMFPTAKATDIDPEVTVKLTFSEPMDESTINASTFRLYKYDSGARDGGYVSGTISYDAATRSASFKPNAPLVTGEYVASLDTQVKDATGVALDAYFNLLFKTR